MAKYSWTEQEDQVLRDLTAAGQAFNKEIAKQLGKKPQQVGLRIRKLGLPRSKERVRNRMGQWNARHAHLREAVLTYFLTHSTEQTREHFGLTASELKSLMTVSYGKPEFQHLRKDKRDHSPWTTEQLIFLLQHSGLRPRRWIAKQLGRGGIHTIKDRLQILGISSRTLQGLTLRQFSKAFGGRPDFYLETDAGPTGGLLTTGKKGTYYKIVPWVYLQREIKSGRLETAPEMALLIDARAMFQSWVFGHEDVLIKMRNICKAARGEKAA